MYKFQSAPTRKPAIIRTAVGLFYRRVLGPLIVAFPRFNLEEKMQSNFIC